MNMKTALRKLYKAISGEDNYKVNTSKLLVDIHKALTNKEPVNKNNHARIISELADNWTGGSGGGGGSNPNTVQTITGTLANPFGSVDADTLGPALDSMNASATFVADASALGAGTVIARLGGNSDTIWGNGASFDISDSVSAFGLTWVSSGSLVFAKMFSGGNVIDISTYASMIPTTLTVVWHPLS